MSKRFHVQDNTGVLHEHDTKGHLFAWGTAAPTAAAAGYSPGCLYINTAGSAGSVLYVNTGTKASATWLNIA